MNHNNAGQSPFKGHRPEMAAAIATGKLIVHIIRAGDLPQAGVAI
jgi:hypothetical protein